MLRNRHSAIRLAEAQKAFNVLNEAEMVLQWLRRLARRGLRSIGLLFEAALKADEKAVA